MRIASVNPPGDGEGAVAEVLRDRLDRAGLRARIVTSPGGRPSLVARLDGRPDQPPLVLLSHTDVVPAESDAWTRDPFGGEVVDGELWGRGTLDMKGVAALHVLAAATLAAGQRERTRELIVVAVADEEAGGREGGGWLVRERPELVGFADTGRPPEVLGEGAFGLTGLVARPVMPIVVGEKSPLDVRVRATGRPGHASLPPQEQAIRSLARFIGEVAGARPARVHPVLREMFAELAGAATGTRQRLFGALASQAGPALIRMLAGPLRTRAGAIGHLLADTITPTQLEAGYKSNVVPGVAEATFDCRLLPDTDPDAMLAWLRRVGRHHGIEVDELQRWGSPVSPRGHLFDLLAEVSADLPGEPLPVRSLTPGMTDLRYFRSAGATAYGWVPIVLGPELVATFHGHDERVPVDALRSGQRAMTEVVRRACSS